MTSRSVEHPRGREQRFASYLLPLLTVLLAMALQLYDLEGKSLWHDELGTLTNAGWGGSWLDAIRNPLTIPTLPKPPLSFLITHLSLTLDSSAFAARLPSVILATLTIPILYVLGKSIFNRQVGLLAAFLLAIAPLQIRYAQEARMYAMLAFFSLLSLYLLWRAIRARQLRWWIGFALVTVLNLYTHQFALLSLGVVALFALCLLIRSKTSQELREQCPFCGWHTLVAVGLILLLYLPMMPFLIEGALSEEGFRGNAAPVYGELQWNLASLVAALRLFSAGNDLGLILFACLFLVALGALLIRMSGITARRRDPQADPAQSPVRQEFAGRRWVTCYALLLLLMWLVLPWVISLSIPAGHGVRIRYLIFLLPVYLLLVAYGLWVASQWLSARLDSLRHQALSRQVVRIVGTVGLLAIVLGISSPSIAAYYAETKQNWRDAVDLVQTSAESEELVFVSRLHHQTGVLFYASQDAEDTDLLTAENVRILPKEPGEDLLPAGDDRGWLIVPVREQYLPGGELDDQLKPYYRLTEPTTFEPASVPRDSQVIGPIVYRSLAVMQIVRIHPPSIRFSVDDEVITRGGCTRLRWEVENVREVYLDGEGVVGQGEREVCPTASTTYELEVIQTDGTATVRTIEMVVTSP